jgi:ribulose-phosphate 3-epimerase
VHLMITPVDPMLQAFAAAGADHLTVHLESGPHIHRSLQTIRAMGCKAGLAINPGSPLDAVPDLLDMVDVLMVMTVNPGFGGQTLIPATLDKVARLRALVADRPIHIQIDGGVGEANAAMLVNAGADVLVAGASLFRGTDYTANISALRQAATAG